jgi:hypothetical protein
MPSSSRDHAVAYVWAYDVDPACVAAFRRAYGPDGAWATFFSRSESYLGTDLLEDRSEPTRFVTIDYFVDAAARARLLEDHRDEYVTIDRRWETATLSEMFLGEYVMSARR